jgi:hypothetical protein
VTWHAYPSSMIVMPMPRMLGSSGVRLSQRDRIRSG